MSAAEALTHGVYLVGVEADGVRNLMTAAWVTQISSNALLAAVGRTHYTAELIRRCGHFSLSVLTEEHREIARRCGTVSGRRENKLAGLPLGSSADGDPVLNGAAAHFSCRVIETVEVLDHVLFCGEIVSSARFEGTPMQYRPRDFF